MNRKMVEDYMNETDISSIDVVEFLKFIRRLYNKDMEKIFATNGEYLDKMSREKLELFLFSFFRFNVDKYWITVNFYYPKIRTIPETTLRKMADKIKLELIGKQI